MASSSASSNVYQQITDIIIAQLENGIIPWRRPWNTGIPRNLISGRAYRGINALMLACQPFPSPFWLTFKQAKDRGGTVRKGEHGCRIVFWKPLEYDAESDGKGKGKGKGKGNADADEDGKIRIAYLNSWTVFNVTQCDGLSNIPEIVEHPFTPLEYAEQIIAGMPLRPPIFHDGGERAFYRHSADEVHLPLPENFTSREAYYAVLFHELGHSTGHATRLARPEIMDPSGFGTDPYSREELVAEMTAGFLCGVTGITPETVTNAAAYIRSWLSAFEGDKRMLINAASQAQKAADFIQAIESDPAPQPLDGDQPQPAEAA